MHVTQAPRRVIRFLLFAVVALRSVCCLAQTDTFPPASQGATTCSNPGANWLSCTISGTTLTLGAATGQASHKVIGTCGSATSFGPCSLLAGDLPTIPLSTGVTGTLPAASLPAPAGGGPPGGVVATTSAVGPITTTQTVIAEYTIPANTIAASTTYRIWAVGPCTGVTGDTNSLFVYLGPNGTSSDTLLAQLSPTPATGTSATEVMSLVTFRSTTSSQTYLREVSSGEVHGFEAQRTWFGAPLLGQNDWVEPSTDHPVADDVLARRGGEAEGVPEKPI